MYIGRPPFVEQLNDISFWFPILSKIGMRTPETKLFYVSNEVGHIVDGKETDEFKQLVKDITSTKESFGRTAFLRTGQTSNKHDWKHTCYLSENSDVKKHLAALIEFSMMVDLPYNTFAVRKMIDTVPLTTAFKDMPIARELRIFVKEGKLICAHPYWPEEAFRGGQHPNNEVTEEQIRQLQVMPKMTEITQMAEYVSSSFQGSWSVDFLEDKDGNWWLTDMALASTGYHWPNCENKDKFGDN